MKTAFATSALAMAGYTDAFVASPAARSSLLHGNSRSSKAAIRATPSMEFAGGLIGADGPEPTSKNFDPLGLSKAQPENILFFRESEIKHGRIAMLAIVGLIVPEFIRLPGDIFQNVSVLDAHNAMVEKGPMWQLLFWISLLEIVTFPTVIDMDKKDREPGDFSLDPLGLCKDPEKAERYKISELKNGRLAMFAVSGALTQMALTNHGFPFLY
ncbi:unnamed protein product [Ascophyllum nodosum]